MRYSKLFGKSVRAVSKEIQPKGHELLMKAGFIRESSSGRFFVLPLGMRVQDRVCAVIEEELSRCGAQKMLAPILHPKELWQETKRTEAVSFELMQVVDRSGRAFVLGGTAEEMMVDVVRQFALSERDLPLCIYQFSTKFRDELRARGGLLRAREFLMKDAYSFHASKDDFESYYQEMRECYSRIFDRLDIPAHVVPADNGYMGGEYCHEFIVDHEVGESHYLRSEDNSYVAHQDIATFRREDCNADERLREMEVRDAVRGATIQDGVELYGQPAWRQIKTIMYVTDEGEFVLVTVRGDLRVSEAKLAKVLAAHQLRVATEDEVRAQGGVVGFLSPLTLKLRKVGDTSLQTVRNFVTGADAFQRDTLNVNYGRDFTVDILDDIAEAEEGHRSVETGSVLRSRRGVEVGNIFQLGTWYSEKMAGAVFTDRSGARVPYYMGCYGIGIGRTIATVAETHADERGLVWPEIIAPFDVHLLSIGAEQHVREKAEQVYAELSAEGKRVLFDDREVSAGVKFADADLIGIPERMVVSRRSLEAGGVERVRRG